MSKPQWQGCAKPVQSPCEIERMPTMGDAGTIVPMTVTAERSVVVPRQKKRNLLRYGRTSCHHDSYNQTSVQKFNGFS